MRQPRKTRPPANGIAFYWSKRERDHEVWHDKRPGDGHWLMWLVGEGMKAVTMTDDERKRGHFMGSYEAGQRFRAQCVERGFDPDTFRVVLRRPKATP